MATIQIREVPEDAYEVVRRRARAAGQSIQSYMRERVIEFANAPTIDEVLAELSNLREKDSRDGMSRESILAALDADRRR